jgi:hypothetical protein
MNQGNNVEKKCETCDNKLETFISPQWCVKCIHFYENKDENLMDNYVKIEVPDND